jgi:microcystin degradation protein MlrC
MRVFTALLSHESNSFSPFPTSIRSYRDAMLYRPAREPRVEAFERLVGHADFVRLAATRGHEVVRGLMATAAPGRPTRQADYAALRDELLGDLQAAGRVDMVLLMLHGAQMADGVDDCEGDLLARLRRRVGPTVPVGVLLDLHFNLTPAMLDHATAIVACKEYPHTDFSERAQELFTIVENAARRRVKPVMAACWVPLVGQFPTTREPMRGFVERVAGLEGCDAILSISLGHSFPWGDTASTASSVVVVADGARHAAQTLADRLGAEFFAIRDGIRSRYLDIDEAIDEALVTPGGPVVIADGSDNPGGGAGCDSTFVVRRLLDRGVRDAAVAWVWDPLAVQLAADAGVGASLDIRIGGKVGVHSGAPLDVRATVTALASNMTQVDLGCDPETEVGDAAALEVEGVRIVLVSRKRQPFGPDAFEQLDIDPRTQKILVVKSNQHFYARFSPLARKVLYCDAPGSLNQRLGALPYQRLPRPVWPLDQPPFDAWGRTWNP